MTRSYPFRQEQKKLPLVLVQLCSHPPLSVAHSSISRVDERERERERERGEKRERKRERERFHAHKNIQQCLKLSICMGS